LLLGSFFVVTSSCLVVKVFRVFGGSGYFEIGSRCLAAILFGAIWCFSGVPRVRGTLLFWSQSLAGRSLLIRDRESVLWIKFGFGLFTVSFRGREVVEAE
jgi:hypothetical protein